MSDLKISKKSWSTEEDALLLRLVDDYGLNGHWSTISSKMGVRTGKQCRERYHNHLKPDIWKGSWSQEEDDLLNESQRTMGNQWAKIAKLLNGRSDNSVKNRWHIINRKKNAIVEEPAIVSITSSAKTVRPVVPKLSFANLTTLPVQPRTDIDFDLMTFYYSHDSHGHCRNATDSTRSTTSMELENCPGSGRRDYTATESAPADVFSESFDYDDQDDDTLVSFIDTNDCEMNNNNFNNTLSSNLSEITSHTSDCFSAEDDDVFTSFEMDDEEEAAWEKSIVNIHANHSRGVGERESKLELNIDRFSEPALSFRDMDSVLDDLAQDDDDDYQLELEQNQDQEQKQEQEQLSEDDELFFLSDLMMDECTHMNTTANASPLVRSLDKKAQLNRLMSMFTRTSSQSASSSALHGKSNNHSNHSHSNFSPRTTPRSPLCLQQQKRQRAGRTPRSPYQRLLQAL